MDQEPREPWALQHSGLLIGAGIFITASVAVVSVFFASRFVRPGLAKKDPLAAESAVRDVGLKLAAGLAAAFAAVLTWGRLELSRQEHQLAKQQHANEVSGQLTERFTRAIDQLGSEKLDIRLGGIYALERIARESREDHGPIMEILTTYLREHSPWPPSRPGQYVEGASLEDVPALATRAADIPAIVTIVGRRRREHESGPGLILTSLDLRNADVTGAHLEGANLTDANLEGASLTDANLSDGQLMGANLDSADLSDAHFEGAELPGVHLRRAHLTGAHLEGVDLTDAYLGRAHLRRANLARAELWMANLERVDLTRAHLETANLSDANLEEANLTGANLERADLTGARLERAELEGAHLEGADLTHANLKGANLRGAHVEDAYLERTGITQEQIDLQHKPSPGKD